MILQGPTLIHVTPLLSTEEAVKSMQPAIDFVNARNGSVVIEELPSWLAFFNKYVPAAQAVRLHFALRIRTRFSSTISRPSVP